MVHGHVGEVGRNAVGERFGEEGGDTVGQAQAIVGDSQSHCGRHKGF